MNATRRLLNGLNNDTHKKVKCRVLFIIYIDLFKHFLNSGDIDHFIKYSPHFMKCTIMLICAVQSQTAVTAYFSSKQLVLFVLAL